MRVLKRLVAISILGGALGACYVESHPDHHPYYSSYQTCRTGYAWDGRYCRYHYNHRYY